MSIDVSHLVILGCSFSYGQGLDNPRQEAWAGLLANRFNVPVVNLASKGGGNDRIMRKLFEYSYLDTKDSNPLYIVAFSHSSRREEYIMSKDDYHTIDMHPSSLFSSNEDFTRPAIMNYNQEIMTIRKIMIQSYILNFFQANNMNYLFTDFCPDTEDDLENAQKIFSAAYDRVYNDPYKLIDLSNFSKQYAPLACGHDGVEAQKDIANYLENEIVTRLGGINRVYNPYISLDEYNDHYIRVGTHGGEKDWL